MSFCCQEDDRRDEVRRMRGRNGLDYVEVLDDQRTLHVYFLGKLPPELHENQPGIERYLKVEGGQRVTNIRITDVDPVVSSNPELDDFLVVKLDQYGDSSTYRLRLTGVENIDPRYDRADFSFKVNCPSDLDCAPACVCQPPVLTEPEIDYLAKDYQSFRQLVLDRMALLMPDWKERHAADLEIMLVELLAYTGDYLSYYQDAVSTEAYIDTARRRESVRRHGRLMDYFLHEGCNARAWVSLEVSPDLALDPGDAAFITGLNDGLGTSLSVLDWKALRDVSSQSYEVFEPLVADRSVPLQLYAAHNEIRFYSWGNTQCCLELGSTSATLIDSWISTKKPGGKKNETGQAKEESKSPKGKKERVLRLKPGDVLIFEEVLGPKTGLAADADPAHRHAVRLKRVTAGEDKTVLTKDKQPTPYVEIEWAPTDALPFTFCISAIGPAPGCRYVESISVARGNVILVDHGKTQDPEELGPVPMLRTDAVCECANEPGDIQIIPGPFPSRLRRTPLTFRAPLPADLKHIAAAHLLTQDVRLAMPQVSIVSHPAASWEPRYDLIASGPDDKHFVVEIDSDGIACLRFGNGDLGYQPEAGTIFDVTYRVGNGVGGNVGAESISRLVLKNTKLEGQSVSVRNPLPAQGGTDPEPLAEAKLFAPHLFRKEIERAIIADDYQTIAARNPKLQRAAAALNWTGSWYEADVAIDPLGSEDPDNILLTGLERYLERFRRMGHDLAVTRARYVPLNIELEVCVLPHYQRAHVKTALLDVFSNRILPGGRRGFFHPDNLSFGEGIYLSRIIAAAQAVAGVECARVRRFQRLFESANHEIDNGVLPLRTSEIAQLDNDPNYPERGKLEIKEAGGR